MRLLTLFLCAICISATTLKTTIADKLTLALQGQPAVGTMTISWPSFQEQDGTQVLGSTMNVRLINGAFTVSLYPTDVATPTDGSAPPVRYTVRYGLTTGSTVSELWSVPTTPATLTIASVIIAGPPYEMQGPSGASLPASCNTADLFFLTTTSQINVCTSPNSWVALTSASTNLFMGQLPVGSSGIPFVQSDITRLATANDLTTLLGYTPTNPANNLGEYASNPSLARTNLGLGTIATMNANQFMPASGNGFVSLVGGLIPVNEIPGLNALGGTLNLPQLNATGALTPQAVLHGDGTWALVDYSTGLANKPVIPTDMAQLANTPGYVLSSALATVATSGRYTDLIGAPAFGSAATHSASDFLSSALLGAASGVAPLNSGSVVPLVNLPTIPSTQISGLGTAAAVAVSTLVQADTLGQANGPAQLDPSGKVFVAELPAIAYMSLSGLPTIPTTTSQLTNNSGFITSSGLATVAVSGSYNDLLNKPSLNFDANGAAAGVLASSLQKANNLSDLVSASVARTNLGLAPVASAGTYASLTGTPTLAPVATSGAYSSLSGLPTIPTTTSQLTNNSGFITSAGLATVAISGSYNDLLNKPSLSFDASGAAAAVLASSLQKAANLSDVLSASTARTNLGLAPLAASGAWADISGKPTFATVATSGSYTDLTNKPGIPTLTSQLTNDSGFLTSSSVAAVAISGAYSDLTGKPTLPTLATGTVPGLVKPGTNLSVDGAGALTINAGVYDPAGSATAAIAGLLVAANNLSDLASASAARTHLGLATVASSGLYTDLASLPTLGTAAAHAATDFLAVGILGAHNGAATLDNSGLILLAELPSIPNTSITGLGTASTHAATDFILSSLLGVNSGVATLTSGGKLTAAQVPTIAYSSLSGTPTLATVATSGSYNDLANLPTLPTIATGSAVGLVKPGTDLTVDGTGTLNVTASAFDAAGAATAAIAGSLKSANNLSDLASASTARTNLGLGTLATANSTTLVADPGATGIVFRGASAGTSRVAVSSDITSLLGFTPLNAAALGAASGAAELDSGGLLLAGELPAAIPYASLTGVPSFLTSSAIGSTIAPLVSGHVPSSYLPTPAIATTSTLGQVIVGTDLTVDGSGHLAVDASAFDAAGTAAGLLTGTLQAANNLSDLANAATARTNLGLVTVAHSGAYSDLSGRPTYATVATSGSYLDLSNKPTIPTLVSQLTNDSGFITSSTAATTSALGLMEVGTGLSVSSGIVSVTYGSSTGTAAVGNDPRITGAVQSTSLGVASGVATLNGSGVLTSSQVPTIAAGSISGLGTAAVQNTSYFVLASQLGANSGAASLDSGGQIPIGQIPTIPWSDISGGPAGYSLPIATSSVLGGVKVSTGLSVDGAGNLSVQFGTSANQALNANLLGVASGVAQLDVTAHIPSSQINTGGANGIAVLDASSHITTGELPTVIAATFIAPGTVTNTAFGYLANVTSDIQAQLNAVNGGTLALNIAQLGGTPNSATFDNYAIIQGAVNRAAVTGLCNVYVPPGIWYVSQGINIPNCVKLFGTASFGQPSSTGGPQYGSAIEAMAGFTGPQYGHNGVSPYPSHFMLYIDGSTSLIGYPGSTVTNETDTYGAQAFNLDVDCNGIANCGGLFVGHRNENSSFHDLEASNWSSYGYFDCGAGTGGSGPGGNTPCGPAGGDNGGGPDDRIQLLSFGSWVTSATQPAVLLQSFNRGIRDWTINNTPGPIYGIYLEAGPGFYMKGVHLESEVNGVWNGPTSGLCATLPTSPHCNGSHSIILENISMDGRGDGGSALGAVVINDDTTDATYNAITYNGGGPALDVLYDAHNGQHIPLTTSAYITNYNIDQHGNASNPNYLSQFTGEIFSTANIVLESNVNPQFVLQSGTSPFFAQRFYADPSGNMDVDSPGSSPGNWNWTKNYAIISGVGNTSEFNGWNLQGLASATVQGGDAAMTVNAYFGSNLSWQTGTTPAWRWGNDGGTGYSGFMGMQSGRGCIATSNASGAGGTELNSAMLAAMGFCISATGNGLFGLGASTLTDSGDQIQVHGAEELTGALKTGTTSNTDLHGTITLASGTGTYTLNGTYTTAPECFSKDKTTPANANSCTCTTTVCTATGTGTDSIAYLLVGFN